MRIISTKALRDFAVSYPVAEAPLRGWRRIIERNEFRSWADLKRVFNSVDRVGDLAVFDIGGNKFRLIAYVRFERQIIYIKAVLTHQQYDKGSWRT